MIEGGFGTDDREVHVDAGLEPGDLHGFDGMPYFPKGFGGALDGPGDGRVERAGIGDHAHLHLPGELLWRRRMA